MVTDAEIIKLRGVNRALCERLGYYMCKVYDMERDMMAYRSSLLLWRIVGICGAGLLVALLLLQMVH